MDATEHANRIKKQEKRLVILSFVVGTIMLMAFVRRFF